MRIMVSQINPTVGDLQGNTKKIIQAIDQARAKKIDLILFPELTICGYPPEDLLYHRAFIEEMEECLQKIIHASSHITVVVGLVRHNPGKGEKSLFNSAAIITDGKLQGYHDKMLLPTYDVFDERRHFEPGTEVRLWDCKGRKFGILICEDIWQHAGYVDFTKYSHDPVIDLAKLKPEFVLNLSASPYQFQKPDVRVKVCAKASKTTGVPVILCCQVGGNDQLVFDGYSVFVGKDGNLCQMGKGFEEDFMVIDLDAPSCTRSFHYDPIRDLYQALVLGVRDYFHKQGFTKGCLGLSGGIDSALTACIACDALGPENVLGITMPSRYSSTLSVTDSEILARNLGIKILNIPIEKPFTAYLELLEPFFEGRKPDVTEENIQARIRGNILMAISNKLGYIVMSTGNKSEMAMGYCTLYGDMAGGLGVISDVNKGQVYALAKWINREKEIIPNSTITKAPSAELRPNQKDTDSLPDYDIVDAVLQAYVENFMSPEEIAEKYKLPLDVVKDLVHRIHLAEYKRRQAAPGIRVSKKAFRVGRQYPIVQKWH